MIMADILSRRTEQTFGSSAVGRPSMRLGSKAGCQIPGDGLQPERTYIHYIVRLQAWMYGQTLQNSLTLSGPKVTRPGPLGLGCTPSTPSLVVGSLHKRSMSTTPPSSIVRGRCRLSICSIFEMDRPMPACHVLYFVYCALSALNI